MSLCQICITNTKYQVKCGCNICLECLINWFSEKNKNTKINHVKCPNQNCSYQYSRNKLLKYCEQQPYQSLIQDILVKEYLKNDDIRPCPNGNCKSFGYINLKKKCDDELECSECGIKWYDYQISSHKPLFLNILSNIYRSMKTFCYCFTTTNECPACGVLIQRNGGCKHMTCTVCNQQFCWLCKYNWNGHSESICDTQKMEFFWVQTFLSLNLLYTAGFLHHLIYLRYPLKLILMLICANTIPSSFIVWMCFLISGILQLCQKVKFFEICQIIASLIFLMIVYLIYETVAEWFNLNIWNMIGIMFLEGVTVLLVIFFYSGITFQVFAALIISGILWYYIGIDTIAVIVWFLPYIFELNSNDRIFSQIIAYSLLFLLNIFDLQAAIDSYKPIILFDISLTILYHLLKKRN